ncbi:MAG: hypothetical protein FJ167_13155 [Gammaproteobacteria bacterium]|nr:hypothetical protein [Gammaproteobacteria bacterium]
MKTNYKYEYCTFCDKKLRPGRARLTWMRTGRFSWHCKPHHDTIIAARVSRRKRRNRPAKMPLEAMF